MPKRDTTIGGYPLLLIQNCPLEVHVSPFELEVWWCEFPPCRPHFRQVLWTLLQVLRELRIVQKWNRGKLQHSHGLWDLANEDFHCFLDIFQAFEPTDSCKLRRSECNNFSQYHLTYTSYAFLWKVFFFSFKEN